MKKSKRIAVLSMLLFALLLCAVLAAGCTADDPAPSLQSVPFEGTVQKEDFEISFYVSGSIYQTGLNEDLTYQVEICYVGNEEEITIEHSAVPYMVSLDPYPDSWADIGVADIGAHTVLTPGEPVIFNGSFPWDQGKLPAGEYTLTLWINFTAHGERIDGCVFEVPLTVQ